MVERQENRENNLRILSKELVVLCQLRSEPNEMYSSDTMDEMIKDKIAEIVIYMETTICGCVPKKGEEIGWYTERHCNKCNKNISR